MRFIIHKHRFSLFLLLLLLAGLQAKPQKPFPDSRFACIEGVCLHYRIGLSSGSFKAKGNVLLIHGFAGSTFSWRFTIPFLQKNGYNVLSVDLPAFGYSDRKNGIDMNMSEKATLLWKLISIAERETGTEGKWILTGHSMGGVYIDAMFWQRPENVAALVYVDAANGELRTEVMQKSALWRLTYALAPLTSPLLTNTSAMRRFLSEAYGQKATLKAVEGYQLPLQRTGSAQAIIRLTLGSQYIEKNFGISYPPVLILWGETDRWIPPVSAVKLRNERPGSRLEIIDGAAHCPMETHYRDFNNKLSSFLSSI